MSDKRLHEQIEALGQEWLQEHFINLPVSEATKLIDFCFFGTRMICVFQDFNVQEIDLETKTVFKRYNLQEIERFEISEDVEEDKVVSFALEKDVQLFSVSCMTSVHVFEYSEEEENSLTHVATIPVAEVTQLLFVDYILVMVQPGERCINFNSWDPDSEGIKSKLVFETDFKQLFLESGSECFYFAAGTEICKVDVLDMSMSFRIQSGHSKPINSMALSSMN